MAKPVHNSMSLRHTVITLDGIHAFIYLSIYETFDSILRKNNFRDPTKCHSTKDLSIWFSDAFIASCIRSSSITLSSSPFPASPDNSMYG